MHAFLPFFSEDKVPDSFFGVLYMHLDQAIGESWIWTTFKFNDHYNHNGMHWFEAICFAILACVIFSTCAFLATRSFNKVPTGLQNLMETIVDLLRGIVGGVMGKDGEKYLPFLGSLFLFIALMNLIGLLPGFRSPTMTLSTTLALGITTFIVVQGVAIKVNGLIGYLKHFCGDMLALAPLMVVVHIFGELAKPLSLSLRLFGNIFGEDKVIETLLNMGAHMYVPVHALMILFAIFTSLLQAFIFTILSTIYISTMTTHEGHEEEHGEEAHAH